MQELLKFKMCYSRPYVLVHWTGLDVAGDTADTWEQLDNLANCKFTIAAFEPVTAACCPTPCRRPTQPPVRQRVRIIPEHLKEH